MRKSNTNTTKNRCSLWGTKAIAITSILLAVMSGCGHDRMDTEPNPPNNNKEVTICTTNTTASTLKVSTITTTAIVTMTSMITTTEMTAKNTFHATEILKKNTITSKPTNKTTRTESTTTAVPVEEYVVYKPSTHYIHKNTCRWNNDAYKIDNTEGIEVRRCSECNPDMEIVNEYIPPVVNDGYGQYTESDAVLLAQLIHRESSVTWEGRVAVASCVINRCGYFGDSIRNIIFAPNQFTTANNLNYYTTEDYNAAVYVLTNGTIDSRIFYFDGCHPDMKNWFYDINYNYIGAY